MRGARLASSKAGRAGSALSRVHHVSSSKAPPIAPPMKPFARARPGHPRARRDDLAAQLAPWGTARAAGPGSAAEHEHVGEVRLGAEHPHQHLALTGPTGSGPRPASHVPRLASSAPAKPHAIPRSTSSIRCCIRFIPRAPVGCWPAARSTPTPGASDEERARRQAREHRLGDLLRARSPLLQHHLPGLAGNWASMFVRPPAGNAVHHQAAVRVVGGEPLSVWTRRRAGPP